MKKIIKLLVFLMVIIIYPSNVFAQVKYYESDFQKKELEEIKKQFDKLKTNFIGLSDDVKELDDLNLEDNGLFIYYEPYFLEKDKITKDELRKALDESEIFLEISYDISEEKKNKIKDKLERGLNDVASINTLMYEINRSFNEIDSSDYKTGYELKKARVKDIYNRDFYSVTNGVSGNLGSDKRLIDRFLKKFNKNPEEVYVFSSPNGTRRYMFAFFDEDNEIKFVDLYELRRRFEKDDFSETEKSKILYTFEDMKKELPVDNGNNQVILYGNKSNKSKGGQSVDKVVEKNKSDLKSHNKEEKDSSFRKNIIYASIATIIILGVSFIVISKRKNK